MPKTDAEKAAKKAAKAAATPSTPAAGGGAAAALGIKVAPTGGDQFVNKEHVGDLLLITPKSLELDFKTSAGVTDTVRATVVVLNERKPGEASSVYEDTLVFGKVVVSQLKAALADRQRALGRLISDEAAKKPGQTAPFRLAPVEQAEVDLAVAYVNASTAGSINPLA